MPLVVEKNSSASDICGAEALNKTWSVWATVKISLKQWKEQLQSGKNWDNFA